MSMSTKADRERRRLEAVAYHEAGHAVASLALRRAIRFVSIVPEAETLGRLKLTKAPATMRLDIDAEHRTKAWIEREILITFAGPAAEAHFTGRRNHIGAAGDFKQAVDIASYHHGLGKVLTKYLDYMMARSEAFITAAQQWVQVERLVEFLLEERHLQPKRVREICRTAAADGKRILELARAQMEEEERKRIRDLKAAGIEY